MPIGSFKGKPETATERMRGPINSADNEKSEREGGNGTIGVKVNGKMRALLME